MGQHFATAKVIWLVVTNTITLFSAHILGADLGRYAYVDYGMAILQRCTAILKSTLGKDILKTYYTFDDDDARGGVIATTRQISQ